ncbi:hypothetical protein TNCV_3788081 [Trichonephila clavipes]|nr:hypothetical protein TNCV_3788081 [Trichonephila clavipes]
MPPKNYRNIQSRIRKRPLVCVWSFDYGRVTRKQRVVGDLCACTPSRLPSHVSRKSLVNFISVTRKFPIHSRYFRRQGYLSQNLEGFWDQKYKALKQACPLYWSQAEEHCTRFLTSTA